MASQSAVVWQIAPDQQLIPNLGKYRDGVLEALFSLADLFSARLEAAAKTSAPWVDRSGAARAGLRSFAVKAAMSVTLYLVHSVSYGVYLELGTSKMAPRPVILPVLESFYAPIVAAARALVSG